jgi:uncharacterized protein (DUF169 family)
MDLQFKQTFSFKWHKYFPGAELPIVYEYTDEDKGETQAVTSEAERCMVALLKRVRAGEALGFTTKSFGCAAGRFYAGYTPNLRKDIAEFLSCGTEETGFDGERYKKTPELAKSALKQVPRYQAPASKLVAKRWDKLDEKDSPEVVVFFAEPDVLSGLITLYNYDEPDLEGGVITPFGSGCAAVVQYPYAESKKEHPRAILGMFDITARPHVPANVLTFAVPMSRFVQMVKNMDESFLITKSWEAVKGRIGQQESN